MKRSLIILLVGVLAGCAGVPKAAKEAAKDVVPPIVDRELFFGDPHISYSKLSPDGKYMTFIKPYKDVRNIWLKGIDEPFEAAKPMTADKRPVPEYFWSQDSKYLLYVQDKGGDENYHIYAVDPTAAPGAETGVPPARDLTPLKGIRALIYARPKNKPDEMIIGLNDRDASYHDVYRLEISTGKRTLLIKNTQKIGFYMYDLEGSVRLAIRQKDDADWEYLRVDGDKLTRIYECTWEESCFPIRFHKDGKRCYIESNKGPDADLTALMLIDVETGKTELVESDPEKLVDFGRAMFSEATDELIATVYVGDRQRIYPKNEAVKRDLEILKRELPEGELGINAMTRDMSKFLLAVSSDVDPGSIFLYDRKTGEVTPQYRSRPDLPSEHLAYMKPIRYKARDGLSIPAYLTVPRGVEAKRLPTVLLPHGGPTARDYWGYDPYVQFLANRGYAVLQVNYRGSTGYGEEFLNAGNKQWGIGFSQHDATDGVEYLIEQGIADPERICMFGGSWGGYMTLAGVAFTPELYKCGVPYVAPSNLVTLLESIPPYWRPFAKGFYMRLGDPEVPQDRQDLESRSPLFFADRIKVPLLVIQGANDPRVKQAESDSIVVAVREKGKAVEYLVAPDEGHGFRSPENRMAVAVAMEKFLAKHLGGRYQKEVPPKIAGQLAKITVDPASVKMPDKSAKALLAKAETAPLPAADGSAIQPVTMNYKAQMAMGPRKMEIDLTRQLERTGEKDQPRIRVTTTMKLPMGEQVDVFDLDGRTLLPVERNIKGMAKVKLTYSADAVKGEMEAGPQKMPVDAKLKAPVFGDGAGLELVIAGLPLEEGYNTTLRTFEPMTQKVRIMKLSVTGKESTQVAAGKFESWILEIVPLDGEAGGGGNLRVRQEAPHHVVRSEYKLPAMMGGGSVTSELTSENKTK